MLTELLLLSLSLSLDAFFVGITYKLRGILIPLRSKCLMLLFSFVYAGVALYLGKMLSGLVPEGLSEIFESLIIASIGLWTLIKALLPQRRKKPRDPKKPLFQCFLKSLGITILILKEPEQGDLNRDHHIDLKESLLLGFALSMDAIGAGIGSGLGGSMGLFFPFCVALCQMVFLSLGAVFSRKVLTRLPVSEKTAGVVSGLLLLLVAVLV